jgi:hypothetical protein
MQFTADKHLRGRGRPAHLLHLCRDGPVQRGRSFSAHVTSQTLSLPRRRLYIGSFSDRLHHWGFRRACLQYCVTS